MTAQELDNEFMLKKAAYGFYVLLLLGFAGTIEGILLIDALPHFDGIVSNLGVDPIEALIVGLAAVLIVRLVGRASTPVSLFWFLIWIIVPLVTFVSLILTSLELLNYHNYVFSTYHVRFDRITMLAIGTWLITLSLVPQKVWFEHWKEIVFAMPVLFLIGMGLIWTWPNDVFLELVKEDHLIENMQVLVLLAGCIFAFLAGKYFFNKNQVVMAVIFFLVFGGLFFIAGDEIDWGQRLIGFATPQQIARENLQGEVTVHNINGIHQLVGYGYSLIAFYGAFAWILVETFLRKQKKFLDHFVPESYLFFFFYLSFIYDFYQLIGGRGFGEWSEPAELLLYLGMTLFLVIHYLEINKKIT